MRSEITPETRFHVPEFMEANGVRALVNVPIFLPGGEAFGLLQVETRTPREFDQDDVAFLRTYATLLGPVIDRLRKLRDLKQNNERLSLIVENARDYAILLSDPDDIITDWFAGAEAVFGWKAHEIVGRSGVLLFTEEDQATGVPEQETRGAIANGSAPNVRGTGARTEAGLRRWADGGLTRRRWKPARLRETDIRLMEEAWWFPAVPSPAGGYPLVLLAERSVPGCIIVDQHGKRFLNEAQDYVTFGQKVLERERGGDPVREMWMVFDQANRNNYLLAGSIMPGQALPQPWYDAGIAFKADDPAALAHAVGLPGTPSRPP